MSSPASRRTRTRLVALGAALAVAPTALLVERLHGGPIHAVAISVGGAVVSLLVLALMATAARAEAETARRQLAAQNERLGEADRLKDEFVAMVSHDLRTPLTSIVGFLDLTLDDELDPLSVEQRRYLEIVQRNAQRLLHLVDDLLFAARLRASGAELTPEELDLRDVAEASVAGARLRAESARVGLDVRTPKEPVLVRADKRRMFQLLDNLLSNALKFTPEGGAVTVTAAASAGAARLEVADTGIGVPVDEQARVFDRFYRTSTTTERQLPGSGLGLHVARAIVEAHGGSISCTSADPVGTVFRVDLPLADASARAGAETRLQAPVGRYR